MRALVFAMGVTLAAAPAGCSSSDSDGEIVVFAAASLVEALPQIAGNFEAAHPGIDVKVSFAGSQSLRAQIEHGARPDVFASASLAHADALYRQRLVGPPVIVAHNTLAIVAPADNPAGIEKLADLPRARRLVLAEKAVPAGAYADEVIGRVDAGLAARINRRVVSREPNVRQVLQKVVLGEADAAIVYVTDARSAGDAVAVIPIARAHNVTSSYAMAVVAGSDRGAAFVDFVRSPAGQATFKSLGFIVDSR